MSQLCHCHVTLIDYPCQYTIEIGRPQGVFFMSPDILIIQDNTGYHLLHGFLHLAMALNDSGRTAVEVQDCGTVTVARTRDGLFVEADGKHLPLLPN
jgi:hypothetical protein